MPLIQKGSCFKCNTKTKVFTVFGVQKCKPCIEETKTGKKGNSGMIYNKSTSPDSFKDLFIDNLDLLSCKKSHDLFVKWYIEHYPKSKGIVGRTLNYLIYYNKMPIGIISASSPPLNYKRFREYFSVENDLGFLNNNVFRIVNKPDDKNIGTKILKIFRNKIYKDYENKYKTKLLGIITFVEPPRSGSIYKADNWEYLGETQGITVRRSGENWYDKQYTKGTKKHIFAYRYAI
jgi:hypothetical protein